jgi:hypothetical protein
MERTNMKQLIKGSLALWLVLALGLTACMPVMPETSTDTPTVAPGEQATTEATEETTEEATEEPSGEATAEPAAEGASGDAAIGELVRQLVAQELQVDIENVELVSVEAVEWPDACLGVYSADTMCAQVITPGYRVVVTVDDTQYQYHTNQDGSSIQLFTEPAAKVDKAIFG